MSETGTLLSYTGKITREELAQVPTPAATATRRPVPHHEIVEALVETSSSRQAIKARRPASIQQKLYLNPVRFLVRFESDHRTPAIGDT